MEHKRQRVQFGWLDLKKSLGPALQGSIGGWLKASAEFDCWIDQRIPDRVKGTRGKHVPIAFN
jgi:hypothetical protein